MLVDALDFDYDIEVVDADVVIEGDYVRLVGQFFPEGFEEELFPFIETILDSGKFKSRTVVIEKGEIFDMYTVVVEPDGSSSTF